MFFSFDSYINQRNRSWNIVESEKALVVSVYVLGTHFDISAWLTWIVFSVGVKTDIKKKTLILMCRCFSSLFDCGS